MKSERSAGAIPNTLFDSARLILRRVEAADQPLLERLFCHADMMHYLGGTWTPDQVRETLCEWHDEWGINNYWYGVLVRKDTAEAIGIAGFTTDKNPDEEGLELAWFIIPEHQKRGFATEITQEILAFAFERLEAERAFAETHPRNEASNRVLEKMGFVNIGERTHKFEHLPGFDKQVVWEFTRASWPRHGK